MKLYYVYHSGSYQLHTDEEGVTTKGDKYYPKWENSQISLGGNGRGEKQLVIPIIGYGGNYQLGRNEYGFILKASDEDDGRLECIAIIDTGGGYDRYRHYDIFDDEGVIILTQGVHAWGAAGRVNNYPVYLALVTPGGHFRLNSKYSSNVLEYTPSQEWKVYSLPQWQAKLALESKGGLEWL